MPKPVFAFRDWFVKAPKNEDRFDGTCGTFGRNDDYIRLCVNLKEKAVLPVLTPRCKFLAVLQWILNIQDMMKKTGFMSFRTGNCSRVFWTRQWTSGFYNSSDAVLLQRPELDCRSIRLLFMEDKVTLGHVSHQLLLFSLVIIYFTNARYSHFIHVSATLYNVILAVYGVST